MPEASAKDSLLDWAQRERASWELLLAEVGQARMALPGALGDLTFTDLLAHLSAWQRFEQGLLNRAATGEVPPPPWPAALDPRRDQDRINQHVYEQFRALSLPEVVRQARQTWDHLEDGLRALPEAALCDPGHFPWTHGEALGPLVLREATGHFHQDHEVALRTWLAGFQPPPDEG